MRERGREGGRERERERGRERGGEGLQRLLLVLYCHPCTLACEILDIRKIQLECIIILRCMNQGCKASA